MNRNIFFVLPFVLAGLLAVAAGAEQPDPAAGVLAKIASLKASRPGRICAEPVYADNAVVDKYDTVDTIDGYPKLTLNADRTAVGAELLVCAAGTIDTDEADCSEILFKFDPSVVHYDKRREMFMCGDDDVLRGAHLFWVSGMNPRYQLRYERARTEATNGFDRWKTWTYRVYLERSAS